MLLLISRLFLPDHLQHLHLLRLIFVPGECLGKSVLLVFVVVAPDRIEARHRRRSRSDAHRQQLEGGFAAIISRVLLHCVPDLLCLLLQYGPHRS